MRGGTGRVLIAIIERDEFAPGERAGAWRGLCRGTIVRMTSGEVFHYLEPRFELRSVAGGATGAIPRATPNPLVGSGP